MTNNRGSALAALLLFSCTAHAGLFGGDAENPSLTIAAAEIAMDVPTPVAGNNLELLLAQAGQGNSLSDMKEQATRKFSDYLRRQLDEQLREHFADEEIPLVEQDGFLTLHNFLDISVRKQLTDLRASGNSEMERGTVELSGDFHYRLENLAGNAVREERVDIADLRVREKYQVKTPKDGGEPEDSTDQAIGRALSQVVERLLDRIDNNLEADELRDMAGL